MSLFSQLKGGFASAYSQVSRLFKAPTNEELSAKENDRLERYGTFWDWYNGYHWMKDRDNGEMPYVNWVSRIVNKGVNSMVGAPPKIVLPDTHKEMVGYHKEILAASGSTFFWDSLQMGSVSGDLFLKIVYDPTREKGKQVYLDILDSGNCFPEYVNGRLERFRLYYYDYALGESMEKPEISALYEEWTKDDWAIKFSGTDEIAFIKEKKAEHPNTYGFLPFVHIANRKSGKHVYGISEVKDLFLLQKEFNKAMIQYIDAVDYDGDPLTALFGFGVDEIEQAPGALWGDLPTEGRIENISGRHNYAGMDKLINLLKVFLHINGSMPVGSLGDEKNEYASGTALEIAYTPILELMSQKIPRYKEGFQEIMSKALRVRNDLENLGLDKIKLETEKLKKQSPADVMDRDKKTPVETEKVVSKKPYYYVELQFQSFLPKNRQEQVVVIAQERKMGLETKRGALERLGTEDVDSKLLELQQEKREEIDEFMDENYQPGQDLPDNVIPINKADRAKSQDLSAMAKRKAGSKRETATGFKNDKGQTTV